MTTISLVHRPAPVERLARTRRRCLAAAGMLVSMLLAASPSLAAEPAAVVRIAASATPTLGSTGPAVRGNILFRRVIDEGWLEARLRERNVKLEWVPITGELGPVTNEAFTSQRIDFAQIGDLPSLIVNSRGVATRLLAANGKGSDLYLVVPPGSTARTIADLKGKRISVQLARPWELGFRKLIAENGLQWSDFKTFNLNPQVSVSALSSGKIDAFFGTTGPLFEHKQIGRIIWSTKGRLQDKVRSGELWGARDFVERNPGLTQLVVTAYVKAQHWVAQDANKEQAIQETALNGTPEEVVRRNTDDLVVAWRDHHAPLLDGLILGYYREAARRSLENGLIAKPVDVDALVEPRFLKAALTELKLESFWTPVATPQPKKP